MLDKHLARHEFLAPEYSVADIATYPWVAGTVQYYPELLKPVAHVRRWLDAVGALPLRRRRAWRPRQWPARSR